MAQSKEGGGRQRRNEPTMFLRVRPDAQSQQEVARRAQEDAEISRKLDLQPLDLERLKAVAEHRSISLTELAIQVETRARDNKQTPAVYIDMLFQDVSKST